MKKSLSVPAITAVLVTVLSLSQASLIISPQYDQDKDRLHNPDYTCWMASASNMLAAAGYAGGNVQTIYDRMTAFFGWKISGLQYQALNWYLSVYPEAGNPYTIVNEYWDNSHVNPDFIFQELEAGYFVGITFWYGAERGHSLTVWGDNEDTVRNGYFSDSDKDTGGNFTWYTWANHGNNDWFLDNYFATPVADVDYVATLCHVPEPASVFLMLCGIGLLKSKNIK